MTSLSKLYNIWKLTTSQSSVLFLAETNQYPLYNSTVPEASQADYSAFYGGFKTSYLALSSQNLSNSVVYVSIMNIGFNGNPVAFYLRYEASGTSDVHLPLYYLGLID